MFLKLKRKQISAGLCALVKEGSASGAWLYMYLPAISLCLYLAAELILPAEMLEALHSENGLLEILQFVIISAALFVALGGVGLEARTGNTGMVLWMLLAACGSFYVAGEEISWGQHIVGWESGDFWKTINDQEETNLHNTSSWLDQKPRLLLELAVIFGGIFIPLAHRSGKSLPFFLSLVAPPFRLLPLAVIVAGLKVSDKTLDTLDLNFFTRVSEVIELYLFYYILLYLADLICKRMASRGKTENSAPSASL